MFLFFSKKFIKYFFPTDKNNLNRWVSTNNIICSPELLKPRLGTSTTTLHTLWLQCHLQKILLSPSLSPTSPSAERLPPERTRTGFKDAGSISLLVGSFGYGWFSNSYPLTDPDPVDYAPACYCRRARPHPLVPSTVVPTESQSAVHCSAHASSRPNEKNLQAWSWSYSSPHILLLSFVQHVCEAGKDVSWFCTSVPAHRCVRIFRFPILW